MKNLNPYLRIVIYCLYTWVGSILITSLILAGLFEMGKRFYENLRLALETSVACSFIVPIILIAIFSYFFYKGKWIAYYYLLIFSFAFWVLSLIILLKLGISFAFGIWLFSIPYLAIANLLGYIFDPILPIKKQS